MCFVVPLLIRVGSSRASVRSFVGTEGAPIDKAKCTTAGTTPFVVKPTTPIVAEKPFISMTADGLYHLNVPAYKRDSLGPEPVHSGRTVGFDQVFVATAQDSAAAMNAALASGLHVVFTPGIYALSESLVVSRADTVLLGLGLATLVSANGSPVITVADVDGVRIGGLMLQAGPRGASSLLQVGSGGYAGSAANPTSLYDVFARVGGPDLEEVSAESMVQIRSGHVVGDNLWLWRADHSAAGLVYSSRNPCANALVVTGDDVTVYGLAGEHTTGDTVHWLGERGASFFFQAEYAYDVTQANFGDKGFVAYRVGANVTAHQAWGTGVYHYFRDEAVSVYTAIAAPAQLEASFVAPVSVFLNGRGQVAHVLNDKGQATSPSLPTNAPGAHSVWYCPPAATPQHATPQLRGAAPAAV